MVQLACTQARELGAHGPHLDEHLLGAPGHRLALAVLVAALPADYAAHAALTGSA